jgi:hypothetical protein
MLFFNTHRFFTKKKNFFLQSSLGYQSSFGAKKLKNPEYRTKKREERMGERMGRIGQIPTDFFFVLS